MLNLMWYLRDRLCPLLDLDERGIETLEWILIGGIVAGVAGGTYALLGGALNDGVTDITNSIPTQVPS